jgi:hypothetical protein
MKALAWGAGTLLLSSAGANAQLIETSSGLGASSDMNWSSTAGRTVGNNNNVFQAEIGWPGINLNFLRGVNDVTDAGFHLGLNYGFEGTTNQLTGLNFAIPIRRNVAPGDAFNVGLHADPGLTIYNNNGSALVGIGGPIGVVAGYRLDPRLTVDVGADVPILLSFSNPTGFLFGPLVGGGAEYLIDRNLAVTGRVRVGPEFAFASGGSSTQAAFQTLIGVAYNAR